jgi:ubiquinone/menaquinone biosynthesis C-methylase UbiE
MTPSRAAEYMKTYGHPAEGSKKLLADVIRKHAGAEASILELGCGNGQFYEYLRGQGLTGRYFGVDFSTALLEIAKQNHGSDPSARFEWADVCDLSEVDAHYDIAVYSHVLEATSSPEKSLLEATRLADRIAIRFFEPPKHEFDTVELREMEVGDGKIVPYIRRSMSRDYYRLILTKLGCTSVDVYRDEGSRDQVHVLNYERRGA